MCFLLILLIFVNLFEYFMLFAMKLCSINVPIIIHIIHLFFCIYVLEKMSQIKFEVYPSSTIELVLLSSFSNPATLFKVSLFCPRMHLLTAMRSVDFRVLILRPF